MASTYVTADLKLNDVTDADWALAYVRFALRDKPNASGAYPVGSLDDDELTAAITANAVVDTGVTPNVTYYPAHRIAASLLAGNPEFIQRWSAAGVSEELRSASEIAREIISSGSWIDATIRSGSSGRVAFGQLRLVT